MNAVNELRDLFVQRDELLAALELLTDTVSLAWPSLEGIPPIKDARAAIAKARGES